MSVEVGQPVPEFTLNNQFGTPVSLADYRGKQNVVLVFFPKAFTGTCTGELCAIAEEKQYFDTDDTVVLAVSTDTDATLKAFAAAEGLAYNLLSDHWPHGAVAQQYGAFLPERGFATRATFVIDKDGVLRWSVVNGPGEARSTTDYRDALAAL
ncbi:MAG TPA: peroxiredoxin [Candidatus Nanopelagicales bacterium]|jgi:peroxiredoxin|nr:peroxiredoxin [Candidatus Nanopelagicales bacterium]